MEDGSISEWLVGNGDAVSEGQVIYRIETDKVEMDVESPAAGTIRLIGEAGETYAVGDLIAEIS